MREKLSRFRQKVLEIINCWYFSFPNKCDFTILLTTHSNEVKHWALPFIECPMWNFKLIYGCQLFSFTYILVVSFNKMLYKGTDQELMELSNPSKMTNYSSGSDPLSSLEAQPQTWPLDTFNCQRSDSISKLSQDSWVFFGSLELKVSFSGRLHVIRRLSVCPSFLLSVNFYHWAGFNQSRFKASLGWGNSCLFKWKSAPFSSLGRGNSC